MTRPIVIGLGQRFRSDDGVGPLVLDGLIELLGEMIEAKECLGDAAELIEIWDGKNLVYLVDAICTTPHEIGKIYRIDALKEEFPVLNRASSSHVLGLAEALQLGHILNRLPQKFIIYGVVGNDFGPGELARDEIKNSITKVIQDIAREIKNEVYHA